MGIYNITEAKQNLFWPQRYGSPRSSKMSLKLAEIDTYLLHEIEVCKSLEKK